VNYWTITTTLLFKNTKLNALQGSLESTQKSLTDQFITLRQNFLVDENNEQIVSDLKNLEKQIKKDSQLKEIIGEIKNICDEIFELEQENKNQFIEQIEQSRI
jgi:hypothetical protein